MRTSPRPRRMLLAMAAVTPALGVLFAVTTQAPASAGSKTAALVSGDLLVATSPYQNDPNIVAGVTQLPPGCNPSTATTNPDPCGTAVENGDDYPYVFNNDTVDGSFGVTSPIILDELTPSGSLVGSMEVPNSTQLEITSSSDQMVTSFSSKSELALNLSTNETFVTFMGYNAADGQADVSNANTPGDPDPTSADPAAYYRVIGEVGGNGALNFTETNAFNGDNGRAAILNDEPGAGLLYAAGNAGNGANPEPSQVVTSAGAQLVQPANEPESEQNPGSPTPVGSFSVSQLGVNPSTEGDKVAKDDNFRGETVYNNVLYYTKGSGSNGVDTVYFVDTTGKACPSGVGLPEPGAPLPTSSALTYDATAGGTITKKGKTTDNPGLVPENMCILNGFPTSLATNSTDANDYPFGMWFANPTTLYVADEGAGDNTYDPSTGQYTAAAASAAAGLQKWVFDPSSHQWSLTYTLQSGLNLGVPYTVPGYPTGMNNGQATPGDGTGLPWAPATAGLRNITGEVNRNGTATIWAETSTVSGSGDQGADPNELVSITDNMAATGTSPPANESFQTVVPPTNGLVVRGVSFAPGTGIPAAGNVTCSGITNSDTTISGNVTVPSGASCTLVDTTVDGNVQVQNGGSLLDTDSTIDGNLKTNNADWVDVRGGSIDGNLQVQGTPGVPDVGDTSTANDLCGAAVSGNVQVQSNGAGAPFDIGGTPDCAAPLSVGGNLQVQNNAGELTIGPAPVGSGPGNIVQGNIQVKNNTGGGSLTDNSAGGNCQLGGDTPGISGGGNTANGQDACNTTA
jgi:hypothetical protein